jgi:hypothetical protein
MFESFGTIKYGPDLQVVAEIDQSISDYYFSLIPKYYYANRQMYKAHITVVRIKKETPINLEYWLKHENRKISFIYNSEINFDGTYFWLKAQSQEIGEIRKELGLNRFRNGFDCYHITIGNVKK